MLNPSLKLNPKMFDKDVEQLPIRKGFGEGLLAAGDKKYHLPAQFYEMVKDLSKTRELIIGDK